MSDGCLAAFVAFVLALGAGLLMIIWRTDEVTPSYGGCLFGSDGRNED